MWPLAGPAKGSFTPHTGFFSLPCGIKLTVCWFLKPANTVSFQKVNNVVPDACYNTVNAWATVLRRMLRPVSASARKRASDKGGEGAECSPFPRGSDQFHSGVRSHRLNYNRKFL